MAGRRPVEAPSAWRPALVLLPLTVALVSPEVLQRDWPDLAAAALLLAGVPLYLAAEWWGLSASLSLTGLGVLSLAAMQAPALDVLVVCVLGVGLSVLAHRFQLERARVLAELARAQDDATRDELTGLLNWRCFKQTVQSQLRMFPDQPLSLLLFDLDNFKVYNDTFGHVAGDRLLVEAARLIARTVPPGGLAFRYGGEEFAVLLPTADAGRAITVAESVRVQVAGTPFPGAAHMPKGHVSVSVGVASFPLHAQYPDQLIERADEALYAAKRMGRNRVVVHAPEPFHPQVRLVK